MTCILNGQELATKDQYGDKLYYLKYYDQFVRDYTFCSESFVCTSCFRENKIVKGVVRYDSLVQCEFHNTEFKPLIAKLYGIFDNNPNVKTINDLGLG